MYKIVLIEDNPNNHLTLEMLIKKYLMENNIELEQVEIVSIDNGIEEMKNVLDYQNIDLIFLDLMIPKVNGIDILETIRFSKMAKQPNIIVVTSLHNKKLQNEAREKKANAFITKPTNINMVKVMLNYYLKPNLGKEDTKIEESFNDEFSDFDDFDDFDDVTGEQKELLEKYNKTHLKVSAQEFLNGMENLHYIIEDFEEIEYDFLRMKGNLSGKTLARNISIITENISRYASVLHCFADFYELSIALRTLHSLFIKTDFGEKMVFKKKEIIANFIKAMLDDLIDWQNHVFIEQDTLDVFYINASVLSSCMQLELIIKNAYEN